MCRHGYPRYIKINAFKIALPFDLTVCQICSQIAEIALLLLKVAKFVKKLAKNVKIYG